MPGRIAQSVGNLTHVVSYWRKYVHEVLVNHFGGLSLPRKSVVRLTDRPHMTLDVYHGVKQQINNNQQHGLIITEIGNGKALIRLYCICAL